MALDTAAKRHSALSWGQPWRTLPFPDSTISQADRQTVAFCYGGILAGAAVTPDITYGRLEFTIPSMRLEYTIPSLRLEYTAEEP